jgi:PhnB protein
MVKSIPEGFHSITPYRVVQDAASAIEFYKNAFGAKEIYRHHGSDGKSIINAELEIQGSKFFLSDEFREGTCKSPESIGGSSIMLYLYTEDVDQLFNQAVSAGAIANMPVTDAFWGDRYGELRDPFGHIWSVATHKKDLSHEEMQKTAINFFGHEKEN